jgi:transposase InsO family protein
MARGRHRRDGRVRWPRPGEHVGLHFIPPGQPWRNGYLESFSARVRDECNINVFWSLTQARVVISDWKHDNNHHRRHSALELGNIYNHDDNRGWPHHQRVVRRRDERTSSGRSGWTGYHTDRTESDELG